LFSRGLIYLALGSAERARTDYEEALRLADSVTTTEALEDLDEFAAEHPDVGGVEAIRGLFV
jgi:hypothetical protein